jgi:hypothetical protein
MAAQVAEEGPRSPGREDRPVQTVRQCADELVASAGAVRVNY